MAKRWDVPAKEGLRFARNNVADLMDQLAYLRDHESVCIPQECIEFLDKATLQIARAMTFLTDNPARVYV